MMLTCFHQPIIRNVCFRALQYKLGVIMRWIALVKGGRFGLLIDDGGRSNDDNFSRLITF